MNQIKKIEFKLKHIIGGIKIEIFNFAMKMALELELVKDMGYF